jgi:hypothetical protein
VGVTTSRKLGSTDHKDVSVGGYKDSKMNQKMDSKMKQKTDIEKVTHRGEIRLEISVDRSNLMPEKWELRKRFRWWRLAEQVKNDRESSMWKRKPRSTGPRRPWSENSERRMAID